nr:unnamed protein product [Callosobruchus analis]
MNVEAHVTTVILEEIYSLGASSDQFPLKYGYNNDSGCYLTTSLSDQDKYRLQKDCFVPDNSFSYPFSVHIGNRSHVPKEPKAFRIPLLFEYTIQDTECPYLSDVIVGHRNTIKDEGIIEGTKKLLLDPSYLECEDRKVKEPQKS